jgi:hypothetical protein
MLPALIPAFALISTGALAANFEDLPSVDKLPAGYAIFDELTPTIGQPYAIVRDGKPTREFYPGAPVYFTYKGKVIGTAIELDKKDFSRGLTFDNLTLPIGCRRSSISTLSRRTRAATGSGRLSRCEPGSCLRPSWTSFSSAIWKKQTSSQRA